VDQNSHRQGIATKLLSQLIETCTQSSFHNLLAILIESNTASKSLLENFGFKEWGRLPNVVESGNQKFDHLYYGKSLSRE
jgi:phosphinothricin acetyltransferase